MKPGRGQPQQYIAGCDAAAGDELRTVDRAHNRPGKVVLAIGIEAGHLRGFAADKRAAVFAAGPGDTGHHLLDDFGGKPPGGQVVEEKQRCRALHRDVVDTMIDQVRAHRVVNAKLKGQLELGADPIRA